MSAVPFGYHGRYLHIDLSTRRHRTGPLPEDVLRRFVGGTGLGTWLLQQHTADGAESLSPEAPLLFVFSPLVGSPLTTSAKFAVMAKSPLTERINDSLSSSHFAIAGKKSGHDALLITGRAESPTCLVIDPATVRFEAADELWGLTSQQAAEHVRERFGKRFHVAAIGPAGERLVRYATVSHDGRHAGRGGLGAVMGAKHLKAVAITGDRLAAYAHPRSLVTYSKDLSRRSFGPATAKYRELGTVSNLLTLNRLGSLPTRNFQQTEFAEAERLSPEMITATHERTRASCAACTIGCEHIFHLTSDRAESPKATPPRSRSSTHSGVRMEYENLFALGPLCGVSDPDVVLRASQMCDDLGLDTISAGATIAFAMECAERGLIDAPGLRFGENKALLETLLRISSREGLGDLLAEGSRRVAAEVGQGSDEFAPHVKGLEIPGYEPRTLQTMALGFAVGTRGADHNRSGAYQADFSDRVDRLHASPEDVQWAIATEDEAAIMDSLILCKFLRGVFEDRMAAMAEMLHLVTGWDMDRSDLEQTAARIVSAKKSYNIRQGWTPAEDTLPKRFLSQAVPDGPAAGTFLTEATLQEQIRAYNLARGWTADGWLTTNSQHQTTEAVS